MNELIRIENGEVRLDSRMIAEHFEKDHKNVLADIRDEIDKLGSAGLDGGLIFQPSSYVNQQNKSQPCYEMDEEGAMQLAARYDAVARRKLIVKIKELKQQVSRPMTQAEIIAASAQQLVEMERKVAQLDTRLTDALDVFTVPAKDDWRHDMNDKINQMCINHNLNYQVFRHQLYQELENTARVDLNSRQLRLKARMKQSGATYKERESISKLDIIERDPKLRPIFEGIVRKYQAKYAG
jgi:Rha family phage regulatory protein